MIEQIRPFFSVIIPCYNSRNTIGILLESIVKQHMLKNEIEVCIADDCSTKEETFFIDRLFEYCLSKLRIELFSVKEKTSHEQEINSLILPSS